jgi:hypothetical protein
MQGLTRQTAGLPRDPCCLPQRTHQATKHVRLVTRETTQQQNIYDSLPEEYATNHD